MKSIAVTVIFAIFSQLFLALTVITALNGLSRRGRLNSGSHRLVIMVSTLVLSFRSFRLAGIVLCVVALSVGLGFGALALFGYPAGFMAMIGIMGLAGIAINDTIVVLVATRSDAGAAGGEIQAVRDVVVRSTRHVVASSLTKMAGFIPLLLSGGGFWPPLAIAIAGGVGGATILALYFVPSVYLLAMDSNERLGTPR